MPPPFRQINRAQFAQLLQQFNFTRRVTVVHFHHTSIPSHADFDGHESVVSMFRHHTVNRGFRDIAQHITIAPDGTIFLGRNWNLAPASAVGHNGNGSAGPFMFETVGNFNVGRDPFRDPQRETVLSVITLVQKRFNLPPSAFRFHRELANTDCPGTANRKADILQAVTARHSVMNDDSESADLLSDALRRELSEDEISKTEPLDITELLRQFEASVPADDDAGDEDSFNEEDIHDQVPLEKINNMSEETNRNPQNQTLSFDLPDGMFRSGTKPEPSSIQLFNVETGDTPTMDVKFTEINGLAIYEGDIVLGKAADLRVEKKGLVINGAQFRWVGGIMPYVIKDESTRDRVEAAIAHWEEKTPIRFREKTDADKDYVSFEDQGGCWSYIGRQTGEQVISIGMNCSAGSAIHEIGHALGLFHEQCRGDRDNFVKIVNENINQEFSHNFDKHESDATMVGNYDFGSIMHYPPTAFSINGKDTIVTKDGQPIGQRDGLSSGDIQAIKEIYPNL